MFYMVCKNIEQRQSIIEKLKTNNILSVFHYISLHNSPFYKSNNDVPELIESDRYSDCLLRLPMFYELDIQTVIDNLGFK